ncbi:hypothetical protein C8Q72DRAFT_859595 [Fomitopsis betulina]|nr:hypothetical protein C8Q72DRAFT_859595 [Fomitopsis betulina]
MCSCVERVLQQTRFDTGFCASSEKLCQCTQGIEGARTEESNQMEHRNSIQVKQAVMMEKDNVSEVAVEEEGPEVRTEAVTSPKPKRAAGKSAATGSKWNTTQLSEDDNAEADQEPPSKKVKAQSRLAWTTTGTNDDSTGSVPALSAASARKNVASGATEEEKDLAAHLCGNAGKAVRHVLESLEESSPDNGQGGEVEESGIRDSDGKSAPSERRHSTNKLARG